MASQRYWRFPLIFSGLLLAGCSTWSTANVDLKSTNGDAGGTSSSASTTAVAGTPSRAASEILVTEKDLADRKYSTIADIEVTVNKTTIFNADPTRDAVDMKLREEAARLNADAVILVRYGSVGVSFMSWGSLEGKGRAVKFVD